MYIVMQRCEATRTFFGPMVVCASIWKEKHSAGEIAEIFMESKFVRPLITPATWLLSSSSSASSSSSSVLSNTTLDTNEGIKISVTDGWWWTEAVLDPPLMDLIRQVSSKIFRLIYLHKFFIF